MKTEKQHFVYHSDNRFTLVGIVDHAFGNDYFHLKLGLAVCRDGDQFSRKMGRIIAYGRAEKKPFGTIRNVTQDEIVDLFYSSCVRIAEEKVNEINIRLHLKDGLGARIYASHLAQLGKKQEASDVLSASFDETGFQKMKAKNIELKNKYG